MIGRLCVTVLADNCTKHSDALAEHGLAMMVETGRHRILFDTGQGRVLGANMQSLGVRLSPLDAIVLSHGHYDHTGGLAGILKKHYPGAVFLHPAALACKYARRERRPYPSIGIPENCREALGALRGAVIETRSATEVAGGIWCTGEIPRLPNGAAAPEGFFLDADGRQADPLADDQALFIATTRGLVVIAGCAHSGLGNTLSHIHKLTGRKDVYALLGGLHLGGASPEQLEEAGNIIDQYNIQVLAPCHCTGMGAHAYLRTRFQGRVREMGAGARLVIE